MEKIQGSTLFIVASPFQCLCMLEAIDYFEIKDYDVLVGYCDSKSLPMIDYLLHKESIQYSQQKTAHVIKDIVPFAKNWPRRYNNFFIGDFYCRNGYSIACLLANRGAKVFYMDDGIQALDFFSPNPNLPKIKFKVEFVYAIYEIIGSLKGIKEPGYFTIFNVNSDNKKIIKNPFNRLRKGITGVCRDSFIIGTNSSVLAFKGHNYYEYLEGLFANLKENDPDGIIYYCPHRRDDNNKDIIAFCNEHGVRLFDTEISVEYDFAAKGIFPKYIVGFTSNALYTLHMLFPESETRTVLYHLADAKADEVTCGLRQRLADEGIDTIDVLNK